LVSICRSDRTQPRTSFAAVPAHLHLHHHQQQQRLRPLRLAIDHLTIRFNHIKTAHNLRVEIIDLRSLGVPPYSAYRVDSRGAETDVKYLTAFRRTRITQKHRRKLHRRKKAHRTEEDVAWVGTEGKTKTATRRKTAHLSQDFDST
jgi:hypothetical protein